MRKLTALTAIICLLPAVASAASNTIFSCTMTDGKPLSIKNVGEEYEFTYGKKVFRNAIKDVIKNEQSMIGNGSGFISSSLELKENGVSYIVSFSQPRNNLKAIEDAGLAISTPKSFEGFDCAANKPIIHNFNKKIMNIIP